MIQTKKKAVFGMALIFGCLGLFSFTSNDTGLDPVHSISIGGEDPCPPGDWCICYTSTDGGTTYRGPKKPVVID